MDEELKALKPGDTVWVVCISLCGTHSRTKSRDSISAKGPRECKVISRAGKVLTVGYGNQFNYRFSASIDSTVINLPKYDTGIFTTKEGAVNFWNQKMQIFEDIITADYEQRIALIRKKKIL